MGWRGRGRGGDVVERDDIDLVLGVERSVCTEARINIVRVLRLPPE